MVCSSRSPRAHASDKIAVSRSSERPEVGAGATRFPRFLKPLALTEYRLAKGLRVSARRINEIVHGKRAVTADTALRLARFFRNSPRFVRAAPPVLLPSAGVASSAAFGRQRVCLPSARAQQTRVNAARVTALNDPLNHRMPMACDVTNQFATLLALSPRS